MIDNLLGLGIAGIGIISLSIVSVIALPVWLFHRREVLRMRGTNTKEVLKLRERLEVIERRCAKLEEQVQTAHLLIADEQRALDKKLSKIVPEGAHISNDAEDSSSRSKKRERAHD